MARIRSVHPAICESEDMVALSAYKERSIPQATRRAVALSAGCEPGEHSTAQCHYCRAPGSISWFRRSDGAPGGWVHFAGLELDHVIPESAGGAATPDNIVLACRSCNRRKGARV
jgi:5-methylcytosine-specific restriction endonuclease McrA